MNLVTVYVDPVGASEIGWTQAAGMPGDTTFLFRTPGNVPYAAIAGMSPQLVLKPYTVYNASAYDIAINDPTGAAGIATIPGSVMVDRMRVEIYSRNTTLQPQRMLAVGRVDINGYSYASNTPLSPATYSQGPAGPPGPQGAAGVAGDPGAPGVRGSRWYTGAGAPSGVPDTRIEGDMYLDESSGDVWRWSDGSWRSFTGV
jgi:hypothetical protein